MYNVTSLEIIYYIKFSGMLSGSKSIKNATAQVTILVLSTRVIPFLTDITHK